MQTKIHELMKQTSSIFLDKEEAVKLSVICLLAGGHLLIEDVPGVGKTTLVKTLAQLLGLKTNRIQFTIDLLPGDILGGNLFNVKDQKFEFHPGPLFAQLILADELNRASPRTQSALLQAMEEGQVSIDASTFNLPRPFFVIATQNPHQNLGTFLLPESQLDRFLLSIELSFASKKTEIQIFQNPNPQMKIKNLVPLYSADDLLTIHHEIEGIHVSAAVAEYVGLLLENSRKADFPGADISTRGGMALIAAAKAWAYLDQRDYLLPEDIQSLLQPVFGHRLGGAHGLRQGREWAQSLQKQTPIPK